MFKSETEMCLLLVVVAFVVLAWTMDSYAQTCPSFDGDAACNATDQKNLKISETAFYTVAAFFAVLCVLGMLKMPKFLKMPKLLKF